MRFMTSWRVSHACDGALQQDASAQLRKSTANFGRLIAPSVLVLAVIALVVLIGGGTSRSHYHYATLYIHDLLAKNEKSDPLALALQEQAEEAEPRMIQEGIRLEKVAVRGRLVTYRMRVLGQGRPSQHTEAALRRSAIESACKDYRMSLLMKDYQVSFRYSYLFTNTNRPTDITVTSESC